MTRRSNQIAPPLFAYQERGLATTTGVGYIKRPEYSLAGLLGRELVTEVVT